MSAASAATLPSAAWLRCTLLRECAQCHMTMSNHQCSMAHYEHSSKQGSMVTMARKVPWGS